MLNLKKDEKHVPSLLLFLIRMVHVDMSFFLLFNIYFKCKSITT